MNTYGRLFSISIFGESHGHSVGVVINGSPAGISLSEEDLLKDLARRKSGAIGTTPRKEKDLPKIISGVFNGKTTGAPLTIVFENTNTRSKDYSQFLSNPRPGHADFTANEKFGGHHDYRGGGHFSGRLTLGLVAAGVIAKKIVDPTKFTAKLIEAGGETNIKDAIDKAIENKNSIGGIVECRVENMEVGVGEPFFQSLESQISQMVFSIPATKGIEFGAGFEAAKMTGSQHNDNIIDTKGKTETNHASGINGGISNGNDLIFRVAIKPTSSIFLPQQTINLETGKVEELIVEGRHDTCIALRVPVVLEAATAIVLADNYLISQKRGRVF